MNLLSKAILALLPTTLATAAQAAGVPVSYQLPPTPGKSYTVTLAITDPRNPDWIVSTFLAAAPRTVTAENQGKFTESWDGLDENFMPLPPGKYGVKGIFMPANKWHVDNELHSITPMYVSGAGAWMPRSTRGQGIEPREPFGGDPVGQPMSDVAVGPNGVAVFYYQYLENNSNNPQVDLKKPVGPEQFIRSYRSGGAAGGSSTATDGETVWSYSTDGGPKYVYRADEKPFGKSVGANRNNTYIPPGWVSSMAAYRDETAARSYVYVAQTYKMVLNGRKSTVDREQPIDQITVHAGEDGTLLHTLSLPSPRAIVVRDKKLFALHAATGGGTAVSFVPLTAGLPTAAWKQVFAVPGTINPADLEVDSRGRFYLSDTAANRVYQLDAAGKVKVTLGRLAEQKPGSYDPLTFMGPEKMATWVDEAGNDRLLVVEKAGPNRTAEWSPDGKLLREFTSWQTKANDGYAHDPEDPSIIYLPGHQDWLTRFKVDYQTGEWKVDAVWPNVGTDELLPDIHKPRFFRLNGRSYLAASRSHNVYRLDGDRWLLSAGIVRIGQRQQAAYYLWNDANGNGRTDKEELRPFTPPGHILNYHGQNFIEDLSYVAIGQGTPHAWRLSPTSFDAHGNPVYTAFTKLWTDPIFAARAEGKATALTGANELDEKYSSDWAQIDGSLAEGFYIQARGGRGGNANQGFQYKISRYLPDGAGGYKIKWRVGRAALHGTAREGEMYGAMRLSRPINGLVSVVDQSRMGVLLFTDDGLYVETLLPDLRKVGRTSVGMYQAGGEFFAGHMMADKASGKIYLAVGKATPVIYEMNGWSLQHNPVQRLTSLTREVTLAATQIAPPSEMALSLRGGAGAARFARFGPAIGEVALDGAMTGWESAQPVTFAADARQKVEVRGLYRKDELLLRFQARLAEKFAPKPLPALERIFTHDQGADTLSFYIQGDAAAPPPTQRDGRPGDARYVFGLFQQDGKVFPVALGLFPEWKGAGAKPQIYRTPVGQVSFAHAGPVPGIRLGHALDADGKGFTITAAIPRSSVPRLSEPLKNGFKTLVNFEATLSGHNKFWWSNSDGSASNETYDEPSEARLYPGSWAPLQLTGIEGGLVVRNWIVAGPFGGPGAEKFNWNLNQAQKDAARKYYEAINLPVDDGIVDLKAIYSGPVVQGWWRDPGKVTWKQATIASLDERVELGQTASAFVAATWIHAPEPTQVNFKFQGHPFTFLRWSLNGKSVEGLKYDEKTRARRPEAQKQLTLQAGWNQVFVRGYCTAYGPFRAGLVLDAPTDVLTTLSLASKPTPEMLAAGPQKPQPGN